MFQIYSHETCRSYCSTECCPEDWCVLDTVTIGPERVKKTTTCATCGKVIPDYFPDADDENDDDADDEEQDS